MKTQSIIDTLSVYISYLNETKEVQRNEDISAFLQGIKIQLEGLKNG